MNYLKIITMNNIWKVSENNYVQIRANDQIKQQLPIGIYNICVSPKGEWYLNRYVDKFTFDYKLYDIENEFINHFIKTYKNSSGNLGCLFNGIKGTGKSVAAKLIANQLELPIIIVKNMDDHNQTMIEYLSSINSNCVLFFDEFEKNFDSDDSTVLQIMDGVYNSEFRKVFLLTTNNLHINKNLLGRPSRIRYVKQFGNLSLNAINEFLKDTLNNQEYSQEIINYINTLSISTIDILKSVVSEINIHGIESFREYNSIMNVEFAKFHYGCITAYVLEDRVTPEITLNNFYIEVKRKTNDKTVKNNSQFNELSSDMITSSKQFKNLVVGDLFNSEEIVQIDYNKSIIITHEPGFFNFYYIENPTAEHSIYNNSKYTF